MPQNSGGTTNSVITSKSTSAANNAGTTNSVGTSKSASVAKSRRGSTPVCIDERASINLESASFHIKVHRSILRVQTHHSLHLFGKQWRFNCERLDFSLMASVPVEQEANDRRCVFII